MGICFKLIRIKGIEGTTIIGSAFFCAEHYLLTCKHNVHELSPEDKLSIQYGNKKYCAVLVTVAENQDLALLYTETLAQEEWIFQLDRIAPEGREAIAYGYPHGGGIDEQRGLRIGTTLDNGVNALTNANGVTLGFSGGPLCLALDPKTVVGVISSIKGKDIFGHQAETARFVPAHVALDLWGEQYGLREKRFLIKADAFGSNSFVYSELKTDFRDPKGNLKELQKFVEDSRPLLWMAVVGPGGSGKSRLCYELARSLNSSWHCELLRTGQLKKDYLHELYENAGRNFLLLIDYAYTDTDELGEWLEECAREVNTEEKPNVRVLLLQREDGSEYFGWLESLLRRHGNLINLRYHEDLKLTALGPEETIALMCSYAENVGREQVDAKALYTVLEKVDPDLTRPLFAMFITDAVLHGDNPREWNREKALAYFSRREKDVVDRTLEASEDARAAKLLLSIATISEGLCITVDLLNSSPLCELREFMELPDKASFGSKLYKARLADWEHGQYTMKPLKPDLLGEYYVLDIVQGMIHDPQRREIAPALLQIAKETDYIATISFLTRLFTDFETDEELARICCGNDCFCQYGVSMGLSLRPAPVLLRNLYDLYGSEIWIEQYARGLYYALHNQTDQEKICALLDELRVLHKEQPENAEVIRRLSDGLAIAYGKQTDNNSDLLLEELRTLRKEKPENIGNVAELAIQLFKDSGKQTNSEKIGTSLDELRALYMVQPENSEVVNALSIELLQALDKEIDSEKVGVLLDEINVLHERQPRNIKVTETLAIGLAKAILVQTDFKKAATLLKELRALHVEQAGNTEIVEALADGLFGAFESQTDLEKADALLDELRALNIENPGNIEVANVLAVGLFNRMYNPSRERIELELVEDLLDEIRALHKKQPQNTEVANIFAMGLSNTILDYEQDQEIVSALLNKLRALKEEQSQNVDVIQYLTHGLSVAFCRQKDPKKTTALLEELNALHKELLGCSELMGAFSNGLSSALRYQLDLDKILILLDILRVLYEEQPANAQVVESFSLSLAVAYCKQIDSGKADTLLYEIRALHKELIRSEELAKAFAYGLVGTLSAKTDPKKAAELLNEVYALYEEQPENGDLFVIYACGQIDLSMGKDS